MVDTSSEGVLKNLDGRRAGAGENAHHVEAARLCEETMPRQVVGGEIPQTALLDPRDRLRAGAVLQRVPRLHLDEHNRRSVARDDVDFAASAAVPAGKNYVPAAPQLLAGEFFAEFPQRHAGL